MVSYEYDAWGKNLSVSGSLAGTVGQANPFRYRSYYYDNESGFYYLQSRYYDAGVRRFINADEIMFLGASGTVLGYNLYAYCENNPVNSIDETGFFGTPLQWLCATIGGILGWVFGDYVARSIGLNPKGSFWSKAGYWAVRGLVVVGGSVLGYIAGTKLLNIITKFVNKYNIQNKLPKIARWFLGMRLDQAVVNDLFLKYEIHIFSKDHIKAGIMKLGTSR